MSSDAATTPTDDQDDPFAWLEDVGGDAQLDWVRAANAVTEAVLTTDTEFEPLRARILGILDSDEKIPYVAKVGDFLYGFWTDASHPRGVWRRTTLESYRTDAPEWDVLIDVDALNEAESENWVWHGALLLRPERTRALVELSRGGADADVTREFDLVTRTFVDGGFYRPEGKGGMSWRDADSVFLHHDFGPDSMTTSGYTRTSRILRRGQPLDEAELYFECEPTDMRSYATRDHTAGFERDLAVRQIAFYESESWIATPGATVQRIGVPTSAEPDSHREWLTIELRDPWEVDGVTHPAGSFLVANLDAFMAGDRTLEALFTPTESTSLAGATWTRNHLVLNVLDDVKNVLHVLTPTTDAAGVVSWVASPFAGAPSIGTIEVGAFDAEETDEFLMIDTGYLTPTTLRLGVVGQAPEVLKQMPEFFDATGLEVNQHFATSTDGTRIPYFQVSAAELTLDGSNPTVLYGYGGFEISMTPAYSGGVGGWVERGGVYVSANIRGGGEYGPRWHAAALRENRNRCYEDFAAVARDLIARGVTSPEKLGTQGGSNGGLLMGNMITQYPELFGAIVCQVPLLDMKRFNHLLAGASWMAEYGDPDGDDWGFIQTFSPYHNVRAELPVPPVLFTTSTRDDRVHPAHARKMFALMRDQGHDVSYYENIEGGHGGAADNKQSAYMSALAWTFLGTRLGLF